MTNQILVICGPTATGKTALALNLAQKFNGELISADSRQIYKGMDIGTGKDVEGDSLAASVMQGRNAKESPLQESIPIWLLDIVSPDQPFSVADYQKIARIVIKDIWKRGKLPVLVGGTGLYIKSIIDGIETIGIPQNQKLREKLSKLNLLELQNTLKKQNQEKWNQMNFSDQQNPRRLVRAIEITRSQGSQGDTLAASVMQRRNAKVSPCYKSIQIGLTASNNFLFQKIDDRVEKRVKQGIVNEIKSLLKKGYTWDLPSMSACGYRVWKDFFEEKATLEYTIQKWKFQEHDYARRQLTWFKKDQRIKWFNTEKSNYLSSIYKLINEFLTFPDIIKSSVAVQSPNASPGESLCAFLPS